MSRHSGQGGGFCRQLLAAQAHNASLLCVGLDPEPAKFPGAWKDDPQRIFDFCAAIVNATHDLVCAFKPQIAYFAAQRAEDALEKLIAHIHHTAPHVPVILDAKRGDIGATADQYAREAFERYQADALTLSPFMGLDSIEPYMRYDGKGLILLCRTSNPGGSDLQSQALAQGDLLFEHIAKLAAGPWNNGGQLGLVVGATYPAEVARVRALAPSLPLLIPGIGAQGGDAVATVQAGWREGGPIIVSSSRAVLYAGQDLTFEISDKDGFAMAARRVAQDTRLQLQNARPVGSSVAVAVVAEAAASSSVPASAA
jgi:orotidine-5'-phosphate decarboxylase